MFSRVAVADAADAPVAHGHVERVREPKRGYQRVEEVVDVLRARLRGEGRALYLTFDVPWHRTRSRRHSFSSACLCI